MKFFKGFAQIEGSDFFCPDSDFKVDGIDADYMSHAIIRGNRFFGGKCENSDAIDIGHGSSDILIENNLIFGFIDKGISVGEKAEAVIKNNVIGDCAMGVGVKDGARATITNTTFFRNDYAVKAYVKTPGFDGGEITIDHSIIALSEKANVEADTLSSIAVSNTLCDSQLIPGENNGRGTLEFEDVANYNFNCKNIHAVSWQHVSESSGVFGAKL